MKTSGEVGIVVDYNGRAIAAGHVLIGLSGGVYRIHRADLAPEIPAFGEKRDNLYAATIAGDLGQVAILEMAEKQKSPNYIGPGTDATDAELIGDIDGWLLGDAEPKGGGGRKLSEILLDYYCPCKSKGLSSRDRYTTFRAKALGSLKDEVLRFATTYAYSVLGKFGGAMASDVAIQVHCQTALNEFDAWLKLR